MAAFTDATNVTHNSDLETELAAVLAENARLRARLANTASGYRSEHVFDGVRVLEGDGLARHRERLGRTLVRGQLSRNCQAPGMAISGASYRPIAGTTEEYLVLDAAEPVQGMHKFTPIDDHGEGEG